MRIYIVQSDDNKGQDIVNLDFIPVENYGSLVEPSFLNGKTIKKAYKDKVGDIIIEVWDF